MSSRSVFLQQLVNALSLGSLYALLSLGIALMFGIMRLINFAYGELIMAGGFVLFALNDYPFIVMVLGAIVAVMILSVGMERIAFRRVRAASPSTMLVTSFAVSILLQNLALIATRGFPKSIRTPAALGEQFHFGSLTIPKLNIVIIVVTFALVAGLVAFLRTTRMGLEMRAAAEDFDMARLLGVRANSVVMSGFAISGLLAGVAAVLLVAQLGNVSPTIGTGPVLIGFVATVMGGIGSLVGPALAGFLLGFLTVGLQVVLPDGALPFRDAFVFLTVILVLIFRPQGLVVAKSARTQI